MIKSYLKKNLIPSHFFARGVAPLAVAIAAISAGAEAADVREGIDLGAGIARFSFADEEAVEGDFGGVVFGGYRFANPWGVELRYASATPDSNLLGSADVSQLYGSVLYHFQTSDDYEPYVSIGAGRFSLEADHYSDKLNSSLIGVGVGIKGYISDRITFRPDFFLSSASDLEKPHLLSSITFSYFLGQTSSKSPVAQSVAAAAVIDSDNDAVEDGKDACPNTPAGVSVDARGCALDSDKDGVADHKDSCPSTARNLKVDMEGCPVQLTEAVSIDLKVNFDSNSSVVKPEYFSEIRRVADFMAQYENSVVVIEGHTDTRGAAAYNKSLSQKRADAVAAVLVSQMGIDQSRVTSMGYGEEQPMADESTREGLLANRRVVAKVSASVTKLEQK